MSDFYKRNKHPVYAIGVPVKKSGVYTGEYGMTDGPYPSIKPLLKILPEYENSKILKITVLEDCVKYEIMREWDDLCLDWVKIKDKSQPVEIEQTVWTVILNKYQRDNLLWLLLQVRSGKIPGDTGDWVSEISYMLRKENQKIPVLDEKDYPNSIG